VKSTDIKINTKWKLLCSPHICGLLASAPSSFSRVLHTSGFRALDIPFTYHNFRVPAVDTAIAAMREMGFRGFSITIPFKEAVLPLLDEICPVAEAIGAVNTVINTGDRLYGINTDWTGVAEAFRETGRDFKNDSCLILGAGGAARAALYAMKNLGVQKTALINRTVEKAVSLASKFSAEVITAESLEAELLQQFSLVINTTPGTRLPYFPYNGISPQHTVLEMVNAPTELAVTCVNNGANIIYGIRMLLHQGLEQFALFTEQEPPAEIMEQSLMAAFDSTINKHKI
jgi:shikimate dehydrogenase